jgi:hypothetical protein
MPGCCEAGIALGIFIAHQKAQQEMMNIVLDAVSAGDTANTPPCSISQHAPRWQAAASLCCRDLPELTEFPC